MDKTYNFFKSRARPDPERPPRRSNSNSKPQPPRSPLPATPKPPQLTRKEREIREAIEYRHLKSKMRSYRFARLREVAGREESSSESEGEEPLQGLRGVQTVDLKDYHRKLEATQTGSSSQERRRFNLRFKIEENRSGTIVRSEASDSAGKKPLLGKLPKNASPSTLSKRGEQWKFISIQLKDEASRKSDLRTHSQRSQLQPYRAVEKEKEREKSKAKSNSTISKHADKVPRLQELGKLNHSKF